MNHCTASGKLPVTAWVLSGAKLGQSSAGAVKPPAYCQVGPPEGTRARRSTLGTSTLGSVEVLGKPGGNNRWSSVSEFPPALIKAPITSSGRLLDAHLPAKSCPLRIRWTK